MNLTQCGEALAELERLLEPHLWLTDLRWQPGLIKTATITGQAKPSGIAVDELGRIPAGEHEPDAIRSALFTSAQDAIRIVEEAGYRHREHPVFTVDGHAQRNGELTTLHTKATLKLTLRLPERGAAG